MEYFAAVSLPFLILILTGPGLIKGLRFLNFGQQIRNEGPASHKKKKGVPTMGGILILFAVLLTSFIILDLRRIVLGAIITMTIMGLVGFFDDIIQIKSKRSLGLKARQKLVGQILAGLILALYVFFYTDTGTSIIIPFSGNELELGYLFLPFVIFTVVALANAVNLTDGLDGLAAGVIIIVFSALAVIISALGY
ncbi:MAG TPA: phospho-N-acetylmuramoyl-pentapeptide-transferase, partial [Halanaerobiales bacterium]|nr:phospho-N-acetylmuramoyl-pentapeptide-transferase [Halanaerobiales bacterium]